MPTRQLLNIPPIKTVHTIAKSTLDMNSFRFLNPRHLVDVPNILQNSQIGNAVPIAGGTDLIGQMKDNLISPELIVNLKALSELKFLRHESQELRIGATTTLTEIINDPDIWMNYPALHEAAESVGSLQIRNVGTIGGNLCQRPRCWYYRSDSFVCLKKGGRECLSIKGNNKYNAIVGGGPSYIVHPSDLAPALIALGARVRTYGRSGERDGSRIPLCAT